MTEIIPLFYGVWLPAKGWLRGNNAQPYADTHPEVAQQVADCVGGEMRFIDASIIDFEPLYLARETLMAQPPPKDEKWPTWTRFWRSSKT